MRFPNNVTMAGSPFETHTAAVDIIFYEHDIACGVVRSKQAPEVLAQYPCAFNYTFPEAMVMPLM